MRKVEVESLSVTSNDSKDNKEKQTQRIIYNNPFIEMLIKGVRDEKIVKEYYEILKKADLFIKTSTPYKMATTADKHGSNYAQRDIYGRKFEHLGFFDDSHKHAGKTLEEVLELEYKERRTNDDDYELLSIFNNKPVEVGFGKVFNTIKEKETNENGKLEYEVHDMVQKSKLFEFPIKAQRDEGVEVINKIEQLTEYLHVKRIGFEHRQLEFFIPLKYKTNEFDENSKIYSDIINFNSIFVKNDYGEWIGFGKIKLIKKIIFNDTHEVWKFHAIEIEKLT